LTSKLKKVKVQDFFQSAKKKTSEKSPLPKTLTYFNNGFMPRELKKQLVTILFALKTSGKA